MPVGDMGRAEDEAPPEEIMGLELLLLPLLPFPCLCCSSFSFRLRLADEHERKKFFSFIFFAQLLLFVSLDNDNERRTMMLLTRIKSAFFLLTPSFHSELFLIVQVLMEFHSTTFLLRHGKRGSTVDQKSDFVIIPHVFLLSSRWPHKQRKS